MTFFAGIGGASKAGVLVKGSNYIETLSQTRIVVFDKTGTLTQGVFEVNGIHHSSIDEAKLVSTRPWRRAPPPIPSARACSGLTGRRSTVPESRDIREISGNGVIARVDGMEVAAGNDKLMDYLGVTYIECHAVGTIIHMAIDGKYGGPYRDLGHCKAPFPEGRRSAAESRSEENGHADRGREKGGGPGGGRTEGWTRSAANCFPLTRWRRWRS